MPCSALRPSCLARWCRRNPGAATAAGLALVLAVGVPTLFGLQQERAARAQRALDDAVDPLGAERPAPERAQHAPSRHQRRDAPFDRLAQTALPAVDPRGERYF